MKQRALEPVSKFLHTQACVYPVPYIGHVCLGSMLLQVYLVTQFNDAV